MVVNNYTYNLLNNIPMTLIENAAHILYVYIMRTVCGSLYMKLRKNLELITA